MIRYYLLHKNRALREIRSFKKTTWVNVTDPTNEELERLSERFHLEFGHLKDALDENEVPRFEEEDQCAYFYTRVPLTTDTLYTTKPVLFILHPSAIFTVSKFDLPFFGKLIAEKNVAHATSVEMFIRFLNEIVNHYSNAISKINKNTNSTTINIDNINNHDIVTLVIYEQILNEFLNAIIQTNAYLKVFITNKRYIKKEEDQDLIEDLFLATGQLIELSKSSVHQVQNIREAYSAIMTNNLNRVIKFFTALTVVFTIPMIIASIYGMNIKLPFENHPYAFVIIIVGILSLSFGAIYVFQKRRWL
jgi:magnesium transporter